MKKQPGTRQCASCKRWLPLTSFLPMTKPGWKVTACDPCVRAKMARYWANRADAADLKKFKELKD